MLGYVMGSPVALVRQVLQGSCVAATSGRETLGRSGPGQRGSGRALVGGDSAGGDELDKGALRDADAATEANVT